MSLFLGLKSRPCAGALTARLPPSTAHQDENLGQVWANQNRNRPGHCPHFLPVLACGA
jgi:hypothetical protein